jgi:hypothetical protein
MMLNRSLCICALASILLLGARPAMVQPAQPQLPESLKERLKAESEQLPARVDEAARAVGNDPDHWRDRAKEARRIGEGMADQEARWMMLGIADRLAGSIPPRKAALSGEAWC